MEEQTAFYPPKVQRASRPRREIRTDETQTTVSIHRAGSSVGIHPEDVPYLTQERATKTRRPPVPDSLDFPRPGKSLVRHRPLSPAPARLQRRGFHWLFYTGVALAGITATIIATTIVPPLLGRWNDDRVYGFPRTYQADCNVGHGTQQNPSSHFLFLNNKGMVEVLEIPGDPDKTKPHLYIVTRLVGDNAAYIPVTGSFADVNGDGKLDVEVTVNNTLYVLYNDGAQFKQNL